MLEKTKLNRGFTLVELIVSLSITITIIALTCSVLISAFGVFNNDSAITGSKIIGDNVSKWFNDNLRYATKLEVSDKNTPTGNIDEYNTAAQIQDGNLVYWNTADPTRVHNYFTEEYYKDMKVSVQSKVTNKRYLTFITYVYDLKGNELYHKESTIELVNMAVAEKSKAKPEETDLNGSNPNYHIEGNLATAEYSENAIFYFSSDLVVKRDDYFPPPSTFYGRCLDALGLMQDNPELNRQYNPNKEWFMKNEGLRAYVRINYYEGDWLDIAQFLDLNSISASNKDGAQPTINDSDTLAAKKFNVQAHFAINNKGNESIIIYAYDLDSVDSLITCWTPVKINLIFVPDKYSESLGSVDMSSGKWYTFLPTKGHKQWSKLHISIADQDRNNKEFYDEVKEKWHPVDGVGCTCTEFHKPSN